MKVAVYTIAKNEAKHVKRWFESAKGADYFLICDTGSDDDTVKIAKELGINVVECRVDPFRFDVARNYSLASLPLDIDWCIALDMDEMLVGDWRSELEKALAEWMNPENADSDVEEEEATAPAAAPQASSKPAATKVENVADAFHDLFK